MIQVSVIVPCSHAARHIRACLEGLLATCFGLLAVGVGCSLLGSAGVATIGRRVDGDSAPA